MKMINTFVALLFSVVVFSQSNNQFAVSGGANYQPVLKGYHIGLDLTGHYYLDERFSLGFEFAYTSKKYSEGFGYETDRTIMYNIILNSVVQYDFLKSEKFFTGAFLTNGVSLVTLKDLNDTRTREVTQEIDGVLQTLEIEVPERLGRDSFYILSSGINFSYKVATLEEEFNTNLYITSRIGYQMAFGNGNLAQSKNFTDFVLSLGVTIKGNF